MIPIIRHRKTETWTSHIRMFQWDDGAPGSGFGFTSDAAGNVTTSNPDAERNYRACLTGSVNGRAVIDLGVETYHHSYTHPAIGRCHCGAEVELDSFTNTCDRCGRDYNSAGQELAPREQWGEETGESPADVLRIR